MYGITHIANQADHQLVGIAQDVEHGNDYLPCLWPEFTRRRT